MGLADRAHHMLLPTPIAWDGSDGGARPIDGNKITWGKNYSPSLKDRAAAGFLPTPQTQGLKVCDENGKTQFMDLDMLPTPIANKVNGCDLNNPKIAERNHANLEEEVAKMVISQDVDAGNGFRLSPLFTEEMMGFPLMWTTLPFLSENGAPNPSKHTATPSSRK